jgi:hypothetical protein
VELAGGRFQAAHAGYNRKCQRALLGKLEAELTFLGELANREALLGPRLTRAVRHRRWKRIHRGVVAPRRPIE